MKAYIINGKAKQWVVYFEWYPLVLSSKYIDVCSQSFLFCPTSFTDRSLNQLTYFDYQHDCCNNLDPMPCCFLFVYLIARLSANKRNTSERQNPWGWHCPVPIGPRSSVTRCWLLHYSLVSHYPSFFLKMIWQGGCCNQNVNLVECIKVHVWEVEGTYIIKMNNVKPFYDNFENVKVL